MSGGISGFFASLSPETQNELISAASQALGSQHRAIGKNTANAGRVREYLASNDAYAEEQMQRMRGQNSAEGDSVSNFQRQNDAFMKLQGDDLLPETQKPATKTNGAKTSPKKDSRPYPIAEDPVNPDARPRNLAQEEATSHYNRDERLPSAQDAANAPQETAQGSGEANSADDLWWLGALLGARAVPKSAQEAVGGRNVPAVRSNTSPDIARQAPVDDIIDAEFSEARDLEAPRKQLPAPQKLLTHTSDDIEYEDVMKSVRGEMSKDTPAKNEPAGEGSKKKVEQGSARKKTAPVDENVNRAVQEGMDYGDLESRIRRIMSEIESPVIHVPRKVK